MRIGRTLHSLWILAPPAVHQETIFILAGPEHQPNNPFSSARVFQRRGSRAPVIEITGHIHFRGFRIEKRKNNFLFFQRGEPRGNRLNGRW